MNAYNFKEVGKVFTNETQKVEIEYDFSKDGGAIGVIDLFQAKYPCVVKSFYAKAKTAVTSDGAATIDCGIKTSNPDALLSGVGKASFTLGAVVYDAANQIVPLKLENDSIVSMEIKAAALTAGKVAFVFEIEQY